jgi:hypothetical protein
MVGTPRRGAATKNKNCTNRPGMSFGISGYSLLLGMYMKINDLALESWNVADKYRTCNTSRIRLEAHQGSKALKTWILHYVSGNVVDKYGG